MRRAFQSAIEAHARVLVETESRCLDALEQLAVKAAESLAGGGKILFFGNGGSAADAQHLAAELTIRFVQNRRPLAALALSTDTSALTACANDFGFDHVFARQIEALARRGDIAVAFSTSGNSRNVVLATSKARELGIFTAAFTGASGGLLRDSADLLIPVPSLETARIQEMHILLGHLLCLGIEERLFESNG